MSHVVIIVSVACFIGVAALVGAVIVLYKEFGPDATEKRLKVLARTDGRSRDAPSLLKEGFGGPNEPGFWHSVQAALKNVRLPVGDVRILLIQADVAVSMAAFWGICGTCAVMGAATAVLLKAPAPLYPVAGLGAGVLPLFWLLRRRSKRFRQLSYQLPEALGLLARALRAGHGLTSAMNVVASEMLPPISTEFGICCEQYNLGTPIDQALTNLQERVPNGDLRFFCTSVRLQQRTGGNLAEILDKISYVVRERFKLLGQVQALTGEGRFSGLILMALPVVIFLVLYYLNPEYVVPLFSDPVGRKMIAVAAALQLLGAYVIKRIVTIDV